MHILHAVFMRGEETREHKDSACDSLNKAGLAAYLWPTWGIIYRTKK